MAGLHNKFAGRGLSVVVFPCNQFGGQEPGDAGAIKAFAAAKAPGLVVMGKVDVNGPGTCDTYRFLKVMRVGPPPGSGREGGDKERRGRSGSGKEQTREGSASRRWRWPDSICGHRRWPCRV